MIRFHPLSIAFGALALAACSEPAQAALKRVGTLEVTVTYTGAGRYPGQNGTHRSEVLDRKLSYTLPLAGIHQAESGWPELDARLPKLKAPTKNMLDVSEAEIEDLGASVDACGDDDDCAMQVMMAQARRLQATGRANVTPVEAAPALPDFDRFLVLGPQNCGSATATVADHQSGLWLEGSEGGSGLRSFDYRSAGTGRYSGETKHSAHCRFQAVIDTVAGTYSLAVPITARVETRRSDLPSETGMVEVAGTHATPQLDAKTRWVDLKMAKGAKSLTGRRVFENLHGTDPKKGTPIRAVVEWKITLI